MEKKPRRRIINVADYRSAYPAEAVQAADRIVKNLPRSQQDRKTLKASLADFVGGVSEPARK